MFLCDLLHALLYYPLDSSSGITILWILSGSQNQLSFMDPVTGLAAMTFNFAFPLASPVHLFP